MKQILLAWSSGKDSAWALHCLRATEEFEVVGLLTTVTTERERVQMHEVRRVLLDQQIAATGVEPWIVEVPLHPTNDQYERAMGGAMQRAVDAGITGIAFGDLFLEDVRAYRLSRLQGTGVSPIFPLWQLDTTELAATMQAAGVRATVTCINPEVLDASFVGRQWDAQFLEDLPDGADPCGENGEFHTFVSDGPMLRSPIACSVGAVEERTGFVFADLVPE